MFRVAVKAVLGNKLRLALTALAVVIGVAFVSGTFVLTDSIDEAFGNLLSDINEGVDVYVVPDADVGEDVTQVAVNEVGPTLPDTLTEEIRAIDGVARAEGFVQGFAQIIDEDGEAVGGMGPPTFGMSFGEAGAVTVKQGRAPAAPGEVIIDAATVDSTGYEVGDTVPVLFADGVREFELVGIAGFGEADNLLGATIAAFDLPTAQQLLDKQGRLDSVAVTAKPGVDADTLRSRIDGAVGGSERRVVTAEQQQADEQQDIAAQLSFISTALLAFAGIALFVGAFLIVNTFSIIVAQRTREFALLRAVGASGAQIRTAVIVEAAVVGVLAGVVGFFGGIGLAEGLKAMFSAFGVDFPSSGLVLAPRTAVVSFVVAVGVTVVAAVGPARRAARIPPVEAMRTGATAHDESISRRRRLGGIALGVLGTTGIVTGLTITVPQPLVLVGGGAAALFIGVALLAPYLAAPVARLVGGPAASRGVAGRLARNNAARNRKRTAATASALMIGVALVTFASIFAASATASVDQLFQRQLGADLTVQSSGFQGLPPAVAEAVRGVGEIGALTPVRTARIRDEVTGEETTVTAVDPTSVVELVDLGASREALAALGADTILVNTEFAAAEDVAVGEEVAVTFRSGEAAELEVVGTYDNLELAGSRYLVSLEVVAAHVTNAFDQIVLADAAPGVEIASARTAVEEAVRAFPNAEVLDQADLREQSREQVDTLLNILIGLLALALIIALIGIVNTLALSVFERTREIGLLRAVGMTRPQVRSMVRWESVIVAVFGALLGVSVGALLGWAVVTALADEGLEVLEFPIGRMVTYVIVAAVAGVLAAVLPARRAARLDVLEAVTTE